MAYGMIVRDAGGNITLDTTDIVARVRYYAVVEAGASGSVVLSDIAGKTVYAVSTPLEEYKIAHAVSISGTTFSWTAQSVGGSYPIPSSQSLIAVILVD